MKLATATSPNTWQCQSVTVILTLTPLGGGAALDTMSCLVAFSPVSLMKTTSGSRILSITAASPCWPASEKAWVFCSNSAETSCGAAGPAIAPDRAATERHNFRLPDDDMEAASAQLEPIDALPAQRGLGNAESYPFVAEIHALDAKGLIASIDILRLPKSLCFADH